MTKPRRPTFVVGKTYGRDRTISAYFGEKQTGISYSPSSPQRVATFSRFKTNKALGYFDGLYRDLFLFSGQGTTGDQEMTKRNRKLADAKEIYLFESKGKDKVVFLGEATYFGHFKVKNKDKNNSVRVAIVHQLRPNNIDDLRGVPRVEPSHCNTIGPVIEEVVEGHRFEEISTKKGRRNGMRSPVANQRPAIVQQRESQLVEEFRAFLKTRGINKAPGLKCIPMYCAEPLEADLSVKQKFIGEAKGDVSRESIRMAIGQLADYGRCAVKQYPHRFILLPEQPSRDLVELLLEQGISVVFRDNSNWVEIAPKGLKGRESIW